jgi:hypothetical protein
MTAMRAIWEIAERRFAALRAASDAASELAAAVDEKMAEIGELRAKGADKGHHMR